MFKKYTWFSVLALILFCQKNLKAQNSYYLYIPKTTGNYTELKDAKKIPWTAFDSSTDMYMLSELNGETFQFYKMPFLFGGSKTIALESNGVVRIDNDTSLIIIDGAFTYLDSINANSSISYLIEGNPGNYIVKAQWKNLKIRNGQTNNYLNFQIWLFQKSGIIEIHYGSRSLNNESGFNISNGPQVGMFFSRDDFTKCFEKLWITGSPTNIKPDTSVNYAFKAMTGVPNEGTVFRLIPRFINSIKDKPDNNSTMYYYPNPAENGIINFVRPGDYKITDLTGKMLLSGLSQKSVDVSSLSKGTYLLYVNQNSATKITIH